VGDRTQEAVAVASLAIEESKTVGGFGATTLTVCALVAASPWSWIAALLFGPVRVWAFTYSLVIGGIGSVIALFGTLLLLLSVALVVILGAAQFNMGFDANRRQLHAPQEGQVIGASATGTRSQDEKIRDVLVELAASAGDAKAQYMLAQKYYNGDGIPKNDAEALKWYRLAAEQGYAAAQFNLGLMYAKGKDVAKNDVEAYFWWNLAAAQGHDDAKYNRDIVETRITRNQIAEVQRRSAIWQPKKQ
jgi:hypothetical protein